ncbi:LysM peptidoglycan-binding domain-containing protein [Actinokineospora enzanensis]|uniref:LysM peptidoglycan-binding domain-containing protein n=1 Tax=Actinokineospora enzanensis TaxID=155975 RepID=UPI000363DCAB|nr:LysM peptidoglycan-binding domain-containing protein [Actinokineospora enzanensis]
MAAPLATRLVSDPVERDERVERRVSRVATPVAPARRSGAGRLRPPTRRRVPGAPHVVAAPECEPRRAPVPVAVLAGLAATVALAIYGLGAAADSAAEATVPTDTAVVRLMAGENLSQLAARVAPGADVDAVVDRIVALNGLDDEPLQPGQPLQVPVSH